MDSYEEEHARAVATLGENAGKLVVAMNAASSQIPLRSKEVADESRMRS